MSEPTPGPRRGRFGQLPERLKLAASIEDRQDAEALAARWRCKVPEAIRRCIRETAEREFGRRERLPTERD